MQTVDLATSSIRALNGASLQDKMYQAVGVTYANQGEESEEWLTDERIRELLGGVKGLDVDNAIKAGEGTEVERLIAEAETLAGRYGSEGTPDLYVGKSENDADNVDPTEASVTDAVNEIAGK